MPISAIYFNNSQEMDDYAGGDNYGSDSKPLLCFGVVINQNDNGNYEYSLRFNSSNKEIYNTISQVPITSPFVK